MKPALFFLLGLVLLLGGCAQTRGTQKVKPPPASTTSTASGPALSADFKKKLQRQRGRVTVSYAPPSPHKVPVATLRLRTTAYLGKKNAISGNLSHGPVTSAASDWSKFPLGTRFRVKQTGKVYVIDDYGSALIGTKTLDLAKRHQGEVNKWGSRWVDVEILSWGSPRRSLEVLSPRKRVRYVRPMVDRLQAQAEGWPAEFHRTEVPADGGAKPKSKSARPQPQSRSRVAR